jgi:hypothetical protein
VRAEPEERRRWRATGAGSSWWQRFDERAEFVKDVD